MEKKQVYFRQGAKVALRLVLEEDIPTYHSFMNNPEVTQFLAAYLPISLNQEHEWYEKVCKPKPDDMTFAIVDKENDVLIGAIGLHKIDRQNLTATTGASIGDQSYWGKGYGTEAKMLLLEFAFNELNLRKIYSEVIGYNDRSVAYSKKCGYVEEARIPEHYFRKGKYWNKIVLAVYREKWQEIWEVFSKALPK